MKVEQSETILPRQVLETRADFIEQAVQVLKRSRREVLIVSDVLDPAVYDTQEFYQAVLDFVRKDRNCRVKILVRHIKPVTEKGHYLLRLARRLSSKVEIRKFTFNPSEKDKAWLIGDRQHLICKHSDEVYSGYVSFDARVECEDICAEFNWLWERHSELDPALRTILL